MTTEIEHVIELIESATVPEDVFILKSNTLDELRHSYVGFQQIIHPDKAGNSKRVHNASAKLNGLATIAKKKIKDGTYGDEKPVEVKKPITLKTKRYTYTLMERIHVGKTCAIFNTVIQDKKGTGFLGIIKIPHSIEDNDLIIRESESLKRIKTKVDTLRIDPIGNEQADKLGHLFPRLLESGKMGGKAFNTFIKLPGLESNWYTVEEIHNKYPKGVSLRIAVFIMNRILQSLDVAHISGIRHGAVLPKHMLIHQPTHAGYLFDWTTSCTAGNTLLYVDREYSNFYASEVLKTKAPTPDTDVYSAAMIMIYLLGGNIETFEIPELPTQIHSFLNKCIQPKKSLRYNNAGRAYDDFKVITQGVLGPPKWEDLVMD